MIYGPAEDSYLIESVLEKYVKNKDVLDMGTGSGILALAAKKKGAKSVLGADINDEAVEHVEKLGIKAVKSDLFSNIDGKFDLIVFNPPYLPEDKREDKESAVITSGGKKGNEIITKFLNQAVNNLNKNGIILLLLSSFTPIDEIDTLIDKLNLKSEIVATKKLFFEELFVLKIEKA